LGGRSGRGPPSRPVGRGAWLGEALAAGQAGGHPRGKGNARRSSPSIRCTRAFHDPLRVAPCPPGLRRAAVRWAPGAAPLAGPEPDVRRRHRVPRGSPPDAARRTQIHRVPRGSPPDAARRSQLPRFPPGLVRSQAAPLSNTCCGLEIHPQCRRFCVLAAADGVLEGNHLRPDQRATGRDYLIRTFS